MFKLESSNTELAPAPNGFDYPQEKKLNLDAEPIRKLLDPSNNVSLQPIMSNSLGNY
ncbi:unnamed protein product, partial [Rotaria socialis]